MQCTVKMITGKVLPRVRKLLLISVVYVEVKYNERTETVVLYLVNSSTWSFENDGFESRVLITRYEELTVVQSQR